MSSWNSDADWWLGVARRHGGLIRATARSLAIAAMLAGLRGSNLTKERPGSWRIAAAPGALGRYEAAKPDLQGAGLSPSGYARGCRSAARRVGV